jgi:regulator of RNase E activity RraB
MRTIIIHLCEGMRIFRRRINVLFHGLSQYSGDDNEICKKIIEGCYDKDKKYFRTSLNNYPEFYSRDFGMCAQALVNLGYREKVLDTLKYALGIYVKYNKMALVISPNGLIFDFPDKYAPDGIAYFFRSLRIAKAKALIEDNKDFLNSELKRFEHIVIDKKNGIVKNKAFSGMRDHAVVKAACYDMIMACMLEDEIDRINALMGKKVLVNLLRKYDLKKNLVKYYWTGTYFKDSLVNDAITGHCNIFPYWLDVITDKRMMESSITSIVAKELDSPLPLKYGISDNIKYFWGEIFVKDWEKDTIWVFLGIPYIEILSKVDKNQAITYLKRYKELILRYKGFIEVFHKEIRPYSSLFFYSDNTMLWASIYLDAKKKLGI